MAIEIGNIIYGMCLCFKVGTTFNRQEGILVIVLTHNTARYLHMHYIDLIEAFIHRGNEVHVIAPQDDAFELLENSGVRCHSILLNRRGLNPLSDFRAMLHYWKMYRRINPDIVFNFSIKPVIYSGMAARYSRTAHTFSMVTGLGYIFIPAGIIRHCLRKVVLSLYRLALKKNSRVFFQNTADKLVFTDNQLISHDQGVVINGTGIDLKLFKVSQNNTTEPVFIVIARMLIEKGIQEFVDAAKILHPKYPQARFQLLGSVDDNPGSYSIETLMQWNGQHGVEYLGETDDVRKYIKNASVFVLPSYYQEGRPRSILEAMAMGKPVITTDWPGCRDPIVDGENGFLVPIKDSVALAEAMESFLVNPERSMAMGVRSREIAEQDYDVHKVNEHIISFMPMQAQRKDNNNSVSRTI